MFPVLFKCLYPRIPTTLVTYVMKSKAIPGKIGRGFYTSGDQFYRHGISMQYLRRYIEFVIRIKPAFISGTVSNNATVWAGISCIQEMKAVTYRGYFKAQYSSLYEACIHKNYFTSRTSCRVLIIPRYFNESGFPLSKLYFVQNQGTEQHAAELT